MNLRTLDLNLLFVFETILRERSVARAAERLHLSQPATSHALVISLSGEDVSFVDARLAAHG